MSINDLPDHVHNWLVHFFEAHSHQTKYQDEVSVMKTISASIIQGSAIGPASYVINSSDLNAISEGNALCKYADDTYVIIPAVNVDTRSDELVENDLDHCLEVIQGHVNHCGVNISQTT